MHQDKATALDTLRGWQSNTKCLTDESMIESLIKSHHLGPSFENFDALALTQHSGADTESTAYQQKFQIQLPECWTQSTVPDYTGVKELGKAW